MTKEQLKEMNALFTKKDALESTLKEIDELLDMDPRQITSIHLCFDGKEDRRRSVNTSWRDGSCGVIDEAFKVFLMVAKINVITELDHVNSQIAQY